MDPQGGHDKLLVLGANGRTGRQLIRRALDAGVTVTALVRSHSRLADIAHPRLSVRAGDPCDPRVLEGVLPGHDAVVSVLGPRRPWRSATAVYPRSAAAVVAAMEQSGVKRLVVTSSALLFPRIGFVGRCLRWVVRRLVADARRMEDQIRTSRLDWTIARTSFLNDADDPHCRIGVEELPNGGRAVSRVAVSAYLLAAARSSRHRRQVVGLCG